LPPSFSLCRIRAVLDAISASGGILILGIGTNILEVTRIRIGNLLPALLYAIVWAVLFST